MDTIAKTVLLVEDNPILARGEAAILEQAGLVVTVAHDGASALEAGLSYHYDLIIMDIDLGDDSLDGPTVAEKILEGHDVPILFLSARTEREIVERTERISSYGYVVKNSGRTVLLAAIKMALKLHAAHSELRQREQDLAERERLLSRVGEVANIGGWEVDLATGGVKWTDQTFAIHEIPVGEAPTTEQTVEFFHPSDRDEVTQAVDRAVETGKSFDLELRLVTATGRNRWVRVICHPELRNGTVSRLMGTFQDITERVKAQRRQDRILRSVKGCILIYNHQTHTYEFMNRELEATIRRTREEVNAAGEGFLEFFHPEDRRRISELIDDLALAEDDTPRHLEYRLRPKNGDWIWCLSSNVPFERDAEGRVLRSLGSFIDITARKERELDRDRELAALQDHVGEMEFAAALSRLLDSSDDVEDLIRSVVALLGKQLAAGTGVNTHVTWNDREYGTPPSNADSVVQRVPIGLGRESVGTVSVSRFAGEFSTTEKRLIQKAGEQIARVLLQEVP